MRPEPLEKALHRPSSLARGPFLCQARDDDRLTGALETLDKLSDREILFEVRDTQSSACMGEDVCCTVKHQSMHLHPCGLF